MAWVIKFPEWKHSREAAEAELELACEEWERIVKLPTGGNEGRMIAARERRIAAKMRCLTMGAV